MFNCLAGIRGGVPYCFRSELSAELEIKIRWTHATSLTRSRMEISIIFEAASWYVISGMWLSGRCQVCCDLSHGVRPLEFELSLFAAIVLHCVLDLYV